jgi:hypothetical protein
MKIIDIAIISSAVLASGAVAAKDSPHARQHIGVSQYYGLYSPVQAMAPPAIVEQAGTRRCGQSPFCPEGPGNVAD